MPNHASSFSWKGAARFVEWAAATAIPLALSFRIFTTLPVDFVAWTFATVIGIPVAASALQWLSLGRSRPLSHHLRWLPIFLASGIVVAVVAGVLPVLVLRPPRLDDAAFFAGLGLTAGCLVGIAQSLIIGRQLSTANWWIALSILGFSLGFPAGRIATSILGLTTSWEPTPALLAAAGPMLSKALTLAVGGAVSGALIGAFQLPLPAPDKSPTTSRVLLNAAGWSLGWFFATLIVPGPIGLIGGGVVGFVAATVTWLGKAYPPHASGLSDMSAPQ